MALTLLVGKRFDHILDVKQNLKLVALPQVVEQDGFGGAPHNQLRHR